MFGQFLCCSYVSKEEDERDIEADIPEDEVIIIRIRVKILQDDTGSILSEGISSHDVEERVIGGQSSPALND